MRRQRDAAGFLLRSVAEQSNIDRVYYFNFRNKVGTAKKCKPADSSNPRLVRCPGDDWGLLGADDDDAVKAQALDPEPSQRVRPVGAIPENDLSDPAERRLTFCLLRNDGDVFVRRISRPARQKSCP